MNFICKLKLFFTNLSFKFFPKKRFSDIVPDDADSRDFLYSKAFLDIKVSDSKIDLREFFSPIEDQETANSCVAAAAVGLLESLQIKLGKDRLDLSKLFAYYNSRELHCQVKKDGGTQVRYMLKQLNKLGICTEDLYPYKVSNFAAKPPKEAYDDAKNRKISAYYRILDINEMKHCIASGYGVIISLKLFPSFGVSLDNGGYIPNPSAGEFSNGRHAVVLVGFDEQSRHFILRNSWGSSVGDKGYFYISYDYVQRYFNDAWTIRS